MARKNLFEYAVLFHPKSTKDAMGNDTTPPTEIVTPLTVVLAQSDKEVSMVAARGLPEKFLDKLDDIDIIIRAVCPL
jgi:hypothetical protein